jgi:hypothetical protein
MHDGVMTLLWTHIAATSVSGEREHCIEAVEFKQESQRMKAANSMALNSVNALWNRLFLAQHACSHTRCFEHGDKAWCGVYVQVRQV